MRNWESVSSKWRGAGKALESALERASEFHMLSNTLVDKICGLGSAGGFGVVALVSEASSFVGSSSGLCLYRASVSLPMSCPSMVSTASFLLKKTKVGVVVILYFGCWVRI
jgi:hypothetical protein